MKTLTSHEIAVRFAEKFQREYPNTPIYQLMEELRIAIDEYEQQVKSVDLADVGESLSRKGFQEVVKQQAVGFQENMQFEDVDFEQLKLIASAIWDDYRIVER
jgi:hypothetical protein